ncbi:MAG TPA: GNAT family N-acetyltransferase [Flavobacteriales bacterium]|nr:GNAT family N-acetyltransferase [Flavobacteriales bacterium]
MKKDTMYNTTEISIKQVTLQDIQTLQQVSKQTFYESFSSVNTQENMDNYLNENLSIEKLTIELNTDNSEFYFAIEANQVIGYLKINMGQAQTEFQGEQSIEIERIYILSVYQSRKIGQLLVEKAFNLAQIRNAQYIWLGVWEKNTRAIQFYKRHGFEEFDRHIFLLGNDPQTDILMKFNLR